MSLNIFFCMVILPTSRVTASHIFKMQSNLLLEFYRMKPSWILSFATLLNEASKSIIMDNFRADLHKKSFNFTHLFHFKLMKFWKMKEGGVEHWTLYLAFCMSIKMYTDTRTYLRVWVKKIVLVFSDRPCMAIRVQMICMASFSRFWSNMNIFNF